MGIICLNRSNSSQRIRIFIIDFFLIIFGKFLKIFVEQKEFS